MRFDSLDVAQGQIWQRLTRAAVDRRSAWHTPALATISGDGAPRVRTLVLRGVDRADGMLRLNSDMRSGKVAEIGANRAVCVHFYDKAARLQLIADGDAVVDHGGPAADAAWARATLFARRCYVAPVGPGALADGPTSGLPLSLETREPTVEESAVGRARFCVLLIRLRRLEFLQLAVTGHRRGAFDRTDAGWQGQWLVP